MKLEELIKESIDSLPVWCQRRELDGETYFESHEWVPEYTDPMWGLEMYGLTPKVKPKSATMPSYLEVLNATVVQLPSQICVHCYTRRKTN